MKDIEFVKKSQAVFSKYFYENISVDSLLMNSMANLINIENFQPESNIINK